MKSLFGKIFDEKFFTPLTNEERLQKFLKSRESEAKSFQFLAITILIGLIWYGISYS